MTRYSGATRRRVAAPTRTLVGRLFKFSVQVNF